MILLRLIPTGKGSKPENGRITSPESVPIQLYVGLQLQAYLVSKYRQQRLAEGQV